MLVQNRLAHRWLRVDAAGFVRRDSVLLLSRSGAELLADHLGEPRNAFVRRAVDAWNNCFHVDHDLEANAFFVELATAATQLPINGLYHWLGEATARTLYRERRARLSPDGWGRYLHASGEVTFFLEWDRSTESAHRLGRKVADYTEHFSGRAEAHLSNVIFVAPTETREAVIRAVIEHRLQDGATCSFWTTTVGRLANGPLDRIWAGIPDARLVPLACLSSHPRSARPVADSIAKDHWWERRPGGTEVA
jgi:hypothetical protein